MPKYYPKSQIKTNLYTNGGEYQLVTTKEGYIGIYFKISNGQYFSGENPNDPTSVELIPISKNEKLNSFRPDFYYPDTPLSADVPFDPSEYTNKIDPISEINYLPNSVSDYIKIKPPKSTQKLLPQCYYPKPSPKDYRVGEFQRFFCKKNNEFLYQEISPDYFLKLKSQDSNVLYSLYTPIQIPWTIIGSLPRAYETNSNIVSLVERQNKWANFSSYFNGEFSQYHINKLESNFPTPQFTSGLISSNVSNNKSNSLESLYTNGGEFLLSNRTNYIGFYHFMPDGTPMTGKSHGEGNDVPLIQIKSTTPIPSPTTPSYNPPSVSGGGGGY